MSKIETSRWKLNLIFRRIRELVFSVRWVYLWTGIVSAAWAIWLLSTGPWASVCLGLALLCVSALSFVGYWKILENPRLWMYLLAVVLTLWIAADLVLEFLDEEYRPDESWRFGPKFIGIVWVAYLWKIIPGRETMEILTELRGEWKSFLSKQGESYRIKKRIRPHPARSGKNTGTLRDLESYLEALFRMDGTDSFLIVSTTNNGEFLQFQHMDGELCVDFPLVTELQVSLEEKVRRAFNKRGLEIVDLDDSEGSKAVQGWNKLSVEEAASAIIGLFSDIYRISENEVVEYEWNEMDVVAEPSSENGS
jgi:hypothetical protein